MDEFKRSPARIPCAQPPHHVRRLAALTLILSAVALPARADLFDDLFGRKSTWSEVTAQMPAAPQDPNFVYFFVHRASTFRFGIDTQSISIGTDGVVRYTLIAQSSAGAKNVVYEGIRCETREYRDYAYLRDSGEWARARKDSWVPILDESPDRPQTALDLYIVCNDKAPQKTVPDIVEKLRGRKDLFTY